MDALNKDGLNAENLASQTDEELNAFIDRARNILQARQKERTKSAVAEIRRIAKEHGLDVAIKKPARKASRSSRKKVESA